MTMSGKALTLIQKSFGDLRLCKDMLVVPPTEHIIRCFVFERTPYKGLFYFWRVVFPLYTQYPFITLTHGRRLAKGGYIDLSGSQLEQSVQGLVEILSQGEVDDVRAIRGPQEFLARFGGAAVDQGYTPRISAFNAALTYYLIGNIPFCLDILDDFASQDLSPGTVALQLSARDLAREMRVDPSAGERRIRALEEINIERFALRPTLAADGAEEIAHP
jgi:hypothetical protein